MTISTGSFLSRAASAPFLKGKWKLILYKTNTDLDPKFELFNLSKDISEAKNVAGEYPEIVSELRGLMDSARTPAECKTFKFASERKMQKK